MKKFCWIPFAALAVALVGCGGDDDDGDASGSGGELTTAGAGGGSTSGGAAGSGTPNGGASATGGSAGSQSSTGGSSAATRTPISGGCARSSGDACTADSDCETGGCGDELCYNPAVSEGITTCDCIAPVGPYCGCVDGACTWWN
jgi:hypothetical protein